MHIPKGGIAFFDSGIGGLTVLAECQKRLKTEIFYYYGDNAHAPYGNLSPSLIQTYAEEAFDRFADLQVSAAVVACNTVTALCVDVLRKRYAFPIIGAEPAIMLAAKQTKGEVLVLVTRGTYESNRFHFLLQTTQQRYPQSKLIPYACDYLAGAIEENVLYQEYSYAKYLPDRNPSAVVLGCTHYLYIKKQIQDYYHCPCYDGNEGIATQIEKIERSNSHFWLETGVDVNKNWERKPPQVFSDSFLDGMTTDDPFQQKGNNTNKCSWLSDAYFPYRGGQIIFLGSGKTRNKHVYEQTFAF